MSRRIALAALALAVLACRSAAPRAEPATLRVLVYNIHAGADRAGAPALDRVARVIRESGADVVLLQEVDSVVLRSGRVDQVAVLDSLTGFRGAFGRSLDYQGGGYGIAILSRWPLLARRTVRLPVEPPEERAGGSREPRSALHVTIGVPVLGQLEVVNTHLDPARSDSARLQEIATVLRLAGALRERGALVLVGGDLNSTPESEAQRRVRDAGWLDAWRTCGVGTDSLTWPDSAPRKRIDYLYLGPRLRCGEARVLTSDASDHRPLLVTVQR